MRQKIHRILANRQREPRAGNRRDRLFVQLTCLLAALSCCYFPRIAAADEAGTSSFGFPVSMEALQPCLRSFENSYYHASADASRGIIFERGGGIQAGMTSPSDFFMFTPTYAFETKVFAAQAAFGTTTLNA
jgi:hypothetical protein